MRDNHRPEKVENHRPDERGTVFSSELCKKAWILVISYPVSLLTIYVGRRIRVSFLLSASILSYKVSSEEIESVYISLNSWLVGKPTRIGLFLILNFSTPGLTSSCWPINVDVLVLRRD